MLCFSLDRIIACCRIHICVVECACRQLSQGGLRRGGLQNERVVPLAAVACTVKPACIPV